MATVAAAGRATSFANNAITHSTGSRLDPNTLPVNRRGRDPSVDTTAVIADLKPFALNCFDQVDVLVAVDFAQDDIADLKRAWITNGLDGAELS